MKSVIVRGVSNAMGAAAIRSCTDAPQVDMQLAKQQHENYVKVFRQVNICCFIVLVTDCLAVS